MSNNVCFPARNVIRFDRWIESAGFKLNPTIGKHQTLFLKWPIRYFIGDFQKSVLEKSYSLDLTGFGLQNPIMLFWNFARTKSGKKFFCKMLSPKWRISREKETFFSAKPLNFNFQFHWADWVLGSFIVQSSVALVLTTPQFGCLCMLCVF